MKALKKFSSEENKKNPSPAPVRSISPYDRGNARKSPMLCKAESSFTIPELNDVCNKKKTPVKMDSLPKEDHLTIGYPG
jgi:hypothetical protein